MLLKGTIDSVNLLATVNMIMYQIHRTWFFPTMLHRIEKDILSNNSYLPYFQCSSFEWKNCVTSTYVDHTSNRSITVVNVPRNINIPYPTQGLSPKKQQEINYVFVEWFFNEKGEHWKLSQLKCAISQFKIYILAGTLHSWILASKLWWLWMLPLHQIVYFDDITSIESRLNSGLYLRHYIFSKKLIREVLHKFIIYSALNLSKGKFFVLRHVGRR